MEFIRPLLNWYPDNARDLPWRHTRDPYRVWVSEVMLQQTRVQAVIGYYERFLSSLPDVAALAAVDDALLMKLWEGLGYYSRARNLKKAACELVARFSGRLPADYGALLSLPGFGEYTAGAVASIAFALPVPAVDGNVLRVWARLTGDPTPVGDPAFRRGVRAALLERMPREAPGQFNQALMELGACVCLPNGQPKCGDCPVRAHCKAYASGTAAALPVRKQKSPRRVEYKTVFALGTPQGFLGYQREETGLLASLWQLPDCPAWLDAPAALERLAAWGLRPADEMLMYERRHIFTHIEWRMRVYHASVLGAVPPGMAVIDPGKALPAAYRVCLPAER